MVKSVPSHGARYNASIAAASGSQPSQDAEIVAVQLEGNTMDLTRMAPLVSDVNNDALTIGGRL